MWWVDRIFSFFWDISELFLDAYLEVSGWVWPFFYLKFPLYGLHQTFKALLTPIADFSEWSLEVWNKILGIFSIEQIIAYFRTWIDYATAAYWWVVSAFQNVWNIVEDWWSSVKYTVQSWIDTAIYWIQVSIDAVIADLAQFRADVQWFFDRLLTFDEIIQWWKDWLGEIAAALIRWGFATLLDVGSLIASAFIEREDFWAGWQDLRGNVTDFFTDPLEFIWTLFTDWFLGPEE